MDLASLEQFAKTTAVQGLGYVLMAAVVLAIILTAGWCLLFLRTYAPKIAQAHLNFVNKSAENDERATSALETLSLTASSSDHNHNKTHEVLSHAIAAAEAHVKRHKDYGSDVILQLENARRAIDRRP